MAAEQTPRQYNDAATELKCLVNSVTPMSEDPPTRTVEKAIALVLVLAWVGGTTIMTLDAIATTVPPFWMPFTALVFLLVGRLWNLEVEKILPTNAVSNTSTSDTSPNDDSDSTR